ncbi:Lrp/AsnC family transcriptional regulator, leucine-responsive regulatory protein [Pseudobutyrivibrio sp. OR37]|uniref:Lrp/AsnC family transcriptional regulator n=1 Tax=Pseudobutyrivibrio sp. OR37 TaxID=1798186 RepID=UPI0008E44B10|nr:Lrp/AsnC family transcriptional regulator [Pseudobutyrivibrio sp. OR37]SFH65722.1 Lrp/AsnC family transcriptional regulator, leucine-responsive regulatory protein [Pseudobutyrivibrio sp. OR37]
MTIPKNYADELDDIDLKIIELLQENARISAKEIAQNVYLSSTSVATRIDNLMKKGIITGFRAQMNPLALGFYTKAFISVEVEPNQKKDFYPYVENIPNIVQCNCVTGDFSMLLEVMFHNTIELDQFIGELQRFGKTKTLIVFSTSVEHRETYWKM